MNGKSENIRKMMQLKGNKKLCLHCRKKHHNDFYISPGPLFKMIGTLFLYVFFIHKNTLQRFIALNC